MTMLLTPGDIHNMTFPCRTSLFTRRDWYDADYVDCFLDRVEETVTRLAARLEDMQQENERLRKEIHGTGVEGDA